MKRYIKKIYYYLKEKQAYKNSVSRLGITFSEYSRYVNNIIGEDNIINDTSLLGHRIKKITNYCYMQCIMEIFCDNIYRFTSKTTTPLIIDCGANIGLGIIYFKQLYPQAKVIAFEADAEIAKLCQYNIDQFKYNDVELHNAAIWHEDTTLTFLPNNSLGGKVVKEEDISEMYAVKALDLNRYVANRVDFLKIDIEGAEVSLLNGIKDNLHNVEIMFVEYHSTVGEPQQLDVLLKIILDAGFRYYIKEAYPLMPHPFIDKENKAKFAQGVFDLQLNIFCYRD